MAEAAGGPEGGETVEQPRQKLNADEAAHEAARTAPSQALEEERQLDEAKAEGGTSGAERLQAKAGGATLLDCSGDGVLSHVLPWLGDEALLAAACAARDWRALVDDTLCGTGGRAREVIECGAPRPFFGGALAAWRPGARGACACTCVCALLDAPAGLRALTAGSCAAGAGAHQAAHDQEPGIQASRRRHRAASARTQVGPCPDGVGKPPPLAEGVRASCNETV